MIRIYYWQAADRIVAVHPQRGMIGLLSACPGVIYFDVEKTWSRMPKTLVYLGEL